MDARKTRMASLRSTACRTEKIIHSYNLSQTLRDATTKAAQQQNNKAAIQCCCCRLLLLGRHSFSQVTIGDASNLPKTTEFELPCCQQTCHTDSSGRGGSEYRACRPCTHGPCGCTCSPAQHKYTDAQLSQRMAKALTGLPWRCSHQTGAAAAPAQASWRQAQHPSLLVAAGATGTTGSQCSACCRGSPSSASHTCKVDHTAQDGLHCLPRSCWPKQALPSSGRVPVGVDGISCTTYRLCNRPYDKHTCKGRHIREDGPLNPLRG